MDSEQSEQPIIPAVYAPNLHLFAFHLWRGLTGKPESLAPNPQHLWQKCDEILQELGFTERLHIYGYSHDLNEPTGEQVNLHPDEQLELTGKLPQSDLTITGLVFTHRLYDSYSLTINLRRPEKENEQKTADIPITFWRNLNREKQNLNTKKFLFSPDFIKSSLGQILLLTAFLPASHQREKQNLNTKKFLFSPDFVKSSLGQTLLLTAFLPKANKNQSAESLQDLAHNCLKQIMPSEEIQRPHLHKLGELFGSPIFEFGGQVLDANVAEESNRQPHILIYLFRNNVASSKFENEYSYWQFINLFYYRNKVVSAYQETRNVYRKIYKTYTNLEKEVKSFQQELSKSGDHLSLSEPQLENLKIVLKQLVALDLEYGRLLRNYKHCRNTITINTRNYQVTLAEIFQNLQKTDYHLKRSELDFFQEFSDRTSPYYQSRIDDEVNYFIEGSNLADKAVASIRGIVEIEQTQRDRTLQAQNEKFQNQFQIIGVGIAVGAIAASSSTLIFQQEPITFPWQAIHGDRPHPFIWAFLLSLAFAGLASLLTIILIKWHKGRSTEG